MKDKKGRFKKGHSGNPAGKAPGTRHKAAQAALNLLDGAVPQSCGDGIGWRYNGPAAMPRANCTPHEGTLFDWHGLT